MKGFYIEVSNNLLEREHHKNMRETLWLYIWFLDKITVIKGDSGKVLGGKPIIFSDVEKELNLSRSTYVRWIKELKKNGYISVLRTPKGMCVNVLKAKKRFKRVVSDVSKMEHPIGCIENDTSGCVKNDTSVEKSDVSKMEHRCVKNGTSLPERCSISGTSNIRQNQNLDIDSRQEHLVFPPEKQERLKTNGKKKPLEKKIEKNGESVNEIIALFLKIVPGDFVGKSSAFAKPPTRVAVQALMERYTKVQIQDLIDKYAKGKTDPYRPSVGTVYEFCTIKLAKVEAYVSKTGGLYAQKSISTDEHKLARDARLKEMAEERKARRESFIEKDEKVNNLI
ncbi:MAG: hypothetical protein WC917_01965 [Bacilli bacterium]|jgi:hypothetical protein